MIQYNIATVRKLLLLHVVIQTLIYLSMYMAGYDISGRG